MSVKVKPSEQVKGGGMDGPHIIKEARYEEFDYPDKEGISHGMHSVGLMLRCRNESGDDREQFYRASDLSRFIPSDDGRTLEPASGHGVGNLTDTCTCAVFMVELDNAGFNTEESDINEDVGVIDGCILDFQAKSLPKVSGGGDRIVPMPAKLLALPEEKNEWRGKFSTERSSSAGSRRSARGTSATASASAGGSRRKKSSRKSASPTTDDNGIDKSAHAYMLKLLEDYETIPRDELADLVLKKARQDENRKEIVARVYEEKFLGNYPEDWEYADETVYALESES